MSAFTMRRFECDHCGGIAATLEHEEYRAAEKLDQVWKECDDCGARGHWNVDGDEEGLHLDWVCDEPEEVNLDLH